MNYRAFIIVWLFVLPSLFGILFYQENVVAHIPEDAVSPFQFYSYFTTSAPVINGDISDSGGGHATNPGEWKDAYIRTIKVVREDGTAATPIEITLLFMNDDTYLYIGVVAMESSAANNGVAIYMDEGGKVSPTADGSHDDSLTTQGGQRNENGVSLVAGTLSDLSWTGSAWSADGDAAVDATGSSQGFSGANIFELRVPLDNAKNDDASNSDLDVSSYDELGIYFRFRGGPNEWWYWNLTYNYYNAGNPDAGPTNATNWIDLKLGHSKKFATVYGTWKPTPPTVDGDISNDFNWADTWERKFNLMNETGSTIPALIKVVEDFDKKMVYFGVIVYDTSFNPNDQLRIYLDEKATAPKNVPDYNITHREEDCLIVGYTGAYTDSHAFVTTSGSIGYIDWTEGDTVRADATEGAGDAGYYTSPQKRYEFEIQWNRSTTSTGEASADYDSQLDNYGNIGFTIRYYEGGNGSEYWWYDIGNDDQISVDDNGANAKIIAVGWGILQTGAPKMKLITPTDGGTVQGADYLFRVDSAAPLGTGANIGFVGFKVKDTLDWISLSYISGDRFEISWDTTKYVNGEYELEIVSQSSSAYGGVIARRFIKVEIANPTAAVPPTNVQIEQPVAATISNTQTIIASATNPDRMEIYIDGIYLSDMIPTAGKFNYNLNTKNYVDGLHTIRARAINTAGEASGYKQYTFDNWDDLTSVDITDPTAGQSINGVYTISINFEADDRVDANYPGYAELYIDGSLLSVEYTETNFGGGDWGYRIALNTVWFDDGIHTIRTVVYSAEKTSLADMLQVNFVNKPILQVMTPASKEVIRGNYNLTIKGTDPNGDPLKDDLGNPKYRVDSGAWYDMANTLTVNYILLSEVCYEISPANAEWVEIFNPTGSPVDISSWTLSDDNGVFFTFPASTSISAYGNLLIAINSASFQSVYGSLPDYSAGLAAGRFGDGGDFILLRNTVPADIDYVEWETPSAPLWSAPRPEASAGKSIQRNPYKDTNSPGDWLSQVATVTPGVAAPVEYKATLDTNTISDGPHTITFQLTDSTGAVVSGSVDVVVDNVILESVTIDSPLPGATIRNVYTVVASPVPPSEASYAELYVDNEFAGFDKSLNATNKFELELLTIGFNDGPHNLKVIVYDPFGSTVVSVIAITIENNPSLYIVKPLQNAIIKGIYEFEINAQDLDGILDDANYPRYRIDGSVSWYDMDYNATSGTYKSESGQWNSSTVSSGLHTVEFMVKDNGLYGLTKTRSIEITVDNLNPSCSIVSPTSLQYILGTYTYQVSANDNIDIDYVEITFEVVASGSDISSLGTKRMTYNSFTGYYEYTVDTTVYTDGSAKVYAKAVDKAGNSLTTSSTSYYIDNTEPTLVVISPTNSEYVDGSSYKVKASSSDTPYTPTVEYRVDNTEWLTMTLVAGVWEGIWNTTKVADGQHTITVRAKDSVGHISMQTVIVIVDNNKPVGTISAPANLQYIESAFTFKVSASDYVGIKNVTLDVFNKTYALVYNPQTGYYETTINTFFIDDGEYHLNATIVDLSNKVETIGPVKFYVDNTPPILIINNPIGNAIISKNESINVTVFEIYLNKVEYKIDNLNFELMSGNGTNWSAIIDTTRYADGLHTLTVRALDKLNHIGEQTIVLIFDNNVPTCVVASPFDGEYIEGTYVFRVSASDLNGITSVVIEVFGSNYTMTYNGLTTYYEYTINTFTIDDGIYKMRAKAMDISGKENLSNIIYFYVDNHYPTLKINSPSSGEYIDGIVKINVSAEDIFLFKVEYRIDSLGWVSMNYLDNWFGDLDTKKHRDGEHTITVRAIDNLTRIVQQSIVVVIDNNAPICAVSAPVYGQYIEGTFIFKVSAMDLVGVLNVTISVFGKEFVATYSGITGYYEYTINTIMYPDGIYTYNITVYDLSGKSTLLGPIEFYLDNNPPVLAIISPAEKAYISDVYTIEVFADDFFIYKVEYKIDTGDWIKMKGSKPNYESLWDTPDFLDGFHTLTVRIIDSASHSTYQSIQVIVDNNPPTCIIASPAPNQYVEGVFTFRVSAKDAVGVANVIMNVLGMEVSPTYNFQTGYYEYSIDTSIIAEDSIRNVSATAFDLAGKKGSARAVNFRVDNHAPSIKIKYPKSGDYVSGYVSIDVNITDAFPGPVEYNIDGSGWVTTGLPWDTTTVADGMHTILIRAKDLAEHSTLQSLTVIVDNNAPTCDIISPVANQSIEGIYVFKISARDIIGIRSVDIDVFGKSVKLPYNSESGYYEYGIDTAVVMDGEYNVSVKAYDLSSKSTESKELVFKVDNHPPEIEILWPVSGAYISGEVRINAYMNETFPSSLMYTVDEGGWYDITKLFNTTMVSDGEHTITIKAVDKAGHITKKSITVIVDNAGGEISLIYPRKGEHIQGSYDIEVYTTISVRKMYLSLDGGEYEEIFRKGTSQTYIYTVDTKILLDGPHNITIKTIDLTGRISYMSRDIFVDNTGPSIEILSPKGAKEGVVIFEIDANDATDIEKVSLNIDGTEWREMIRASEGKYIYKLNTKILDNGEHTFEVRAFDALGNSNAKSGKFIVANQPNYWQLMLSSLPFIAYISGIVFLVLLFALVRIGKLQAWIRGVKKEERIEMKAIEQKKVKAEIPLIDSIKGIKVSEQVEYECPKCNAKVKAEDKVCPNCGVEFE
ncbi:MAG: Ig-like domain-containing protein [Candidatus Thermoplasmatota archaeon]